MRLARLSRVFGILSILMGLAVVPAYSADVSLLKPLAGVYPVLERDSRQDIAETLTIFADDEHSGVVSTPILGSPVVFAPVNLVYSKNQTKLTAVTKGVLQENVVGDVPMHILYIVLDGFLSVRTERCPVNASCEVHQFTLSRGRAPGMEMGAPEFFKKFKGEYVIKLAGGTEPKPSNREALIDSDADPKEAALYAPFCPPHSNVCLAGDHYFKYDRTKVFMTTPASGTTIYTLLQGVFPKLNHYQWVLAENKLRFRDYQLKTEAGIIFLEHLLVSAKTAQRDGEVE